MVNATVPMKTSISKRPRTTNIWYFMEQYMIHDIPVLHWFEHYPNFQLDVVAYIDQP